MKYLKTFEQISQGKEVSILMTKDRKYFVRSHISTNFSIGSYSNTHSFIDVCMTFIDPVDNISSNYMKTEKVVNDDLSEIKNCDVVITCIKKNSQEYDGYIYIKNEDISAAFINMMADEGEFFEGVKYIFDEYS